MEYLSLSTPVSALKGVGEKRLAALHRAEINTVGDLLNFFPRQYRSYKIYPLSFERCGFFSGFYLTALSAPGLFTMNGGRRALRFLAEDENGNRVTVLYINQPYLKNRLQKGESAYYFGTLQEKGGVFYLFSPERKSEMPDPDRLYPIYSTVNGISSTQMEKLVAQCLVPVLGEIKETLPQNLLLDRKFPSRAKAVFTLHLPESEKALQSAKERIAFEGLFDFSVKAVLFAKERSQRCVPPYRKVDMTPFLSALPFSLTDAQKRVLIEIESDLVGNDPIPPMNRLLQGDVGSGKTVVAAAAAYLTAQNKKSTLVMAPTEILARQHYASFQKFFAHTNIPVFLITGSVSQKKREEIYQTTGKNTPYILIGTHALIEDSVLCQGVGLAITDEQHRFGVRHRTVLSEKGNAVHSLVMSATPIPRSLAMFLYAKGKISIIDSMPPNRQEVETLYVGEDKEARIYRFLEEKVKSRQQGYVVCPLIEDEEDKSPLQSAKEEYAAIQKALPEVSCALLHGKMKNDEKNQIMSDFKENKISLLVSTTVIEVGVDVPNATVMIIRNAERFGLSQLHQLRGRVGRGSEKSYCILISSHKAKSTRERLRKLCECHDGFELAKYDLKTRGPGEFFGSEQSGFGGLDLGDALTMPLLKEAMESAERFIQVATEEELFPYQNKIRLN